MGVFVTSALDTSHADAVPNSINPRYSVEVSLRKGPEQVLWSNSTPASHAGDHQTSNQHPMLVLAYKNLVQQC